MVESYKLDDDGIKTPKYYFFAKGHNVSERRPLHIISKLTTYYL